MHNYCGVMTFPMLRNWVDGVEGGAHTPINDKYLYNEAISYSPHFRICDY